MKEIVSGHYFDSNEAIKIAGSFYLRKSNVSQSNQIIYYMPNEGVFFEHTQYYEYLSPHSTINEIEEDVELRTEE